MRSLFTKLERNLYLPNGTSGHGFDGYLETNIGDGNQYPTSPQAVDVLNAMVEEMGKDPADLKSMLTADPNYLDPERDTTTGLWALPFHVNTTWGRYSSRNRILDTINSVNPDGSKKSPLTLQLNSLATRVLFETAATESLSLLASSFWKGKAYIKAIRDPTLRRRVS
jgi:choline dehydrogenase